MAHSKRFLLGAGVGGKTLYSQQSAVCMEKRLAGVFWTSQKRSLHEAKGLGEIKEKPMGKRFKCFVCEEKRNRSFRRFWHEYNYNLAHRRAHVAHHHHIFIYHSSLHFHTQVHTICYLQVGSESPSIRRAAVVWNYGNLFWCSVHQFPKREKEFLVFPLWKYC